MKATQSASAINPFPNCPALDGCHCITASLAKIYRHAGHPLSEEMLLGLGAGMGFIYWQMKMGGGVFVFVGGRSNDKNFYTDLGARTGVAIRGICTSSAKKAEAELLSELAQRRPVMLGGDMAYLPWFNLPKDYHFGGHAFVVCGYDGQRTLLASDIDPKMSGVKKGVYGTITLDQLARARSSTFKPFPPKNVRFAFDFSGFREPGRKQIAASIAQTVEAHIHPPIKNFGIAGLRHAAKVLPQWPKLFKSGHDLRMNLFNLFVMIEIGGTGGGCFRPMYARFLEQAAPLLATKTLESAARLFHESGTKFTQIALLFKDAGKMKAVDEKILAASRLFTEIAGIEERACRLLRNVT
ncbi:MAG: BtrH N-terminal domain-containing protein [Terracidiphilus sp.]|jgi:hypothetical protein